MMSLPFPAAAARRALGLIATAAIAAPLAAGDSAADTQTFTPARYALVAAEIDAATLQPGAGGPTGRRRVLVKLDTATGRCWVLQLQIAGADDPQVLAANWAAVAEAVSHPRPMTPGGNTQSDSGGGF